MKKDDDDLERQEDDGDHIDEVGDQQAPVLEGSHRVERYLSIEDQARDYPHKVILIAMLALSVALLVSFLDSTSVSSTVPTVAAQFNASDQFSWVGTSFLIANTSFQILYGRISDIFGRKSVLISAIALFAAGNLMCGFAQSMVQLIVFRGFSGAGGGGINSLAMIIISDMVPLRDRGSYQGYIGAFIGLGSGLGPLAGAVFTEKVTWRWTFWFTVPISVCVIILIWYILPLKPVRGNIKSKIMRVDFVGSLLSLAGTILLLIPVSGGGATYAWDSPLVISMFVIGGLLYIAFVVYEWRFARLPIMPIEPFKNLSVSLVMAQTFLVGIVYYGQLFYLIYYYQTVLRLSIIASGLLLLPLILTQTATAAISGKIIQKTGRYNPCIWAGFLIWTIGLGLQLLFTQDVSVGTIIGILIFEGIGLGPTLQSTLVAAQANSHPRNRAVVTGARNFFRTLGGAFGLAMCGAIFNNVLLKTVTNDPTIPAEVAAHLSRSSLSLPPDLTDAEINAIIAGYVS